MVKSLEAIKIKTLIIVPAYNEALNIEKTIKDIKKNTDYDYVVINDCSKDNTKEVCGKNGFNMVSLPINFGLTSAIQVGMKYAKENGYDIAIQFDGDGQHDVNYVKTIVDPILNGKADMVIGSRFINKDMDNFKSSQVRRLGIRLLSRVIAFKTKKKIYDTTSGFRAVNRDIMEFFAQHYPTEYPEPISTVEVLSRHMTVLELPVKMKAREHGKSSITLVKSIYYMINVIFSILIMKKVK